MLGSTEPVPSSVRGRTWARLGLGLFSLAAAGHALGFWDLSRMAQDGPDLCVFHRVTGWNCPGCGMGRALLLLAQGRWEASWAMHPFAILMMAALTAWSVAPNFLVARWNDPGNRIRHAAPFLALGALLARWVILLAVHA